MIKKIIFFLLIKSTMGDLQFLEQFLRNFIYFEEAYKYSPSAPKKPALYPVVQTTGQLAPAYQVDKYPDADFTKPTGYVIYGPKPPSDGKIYDQIEDWILDILNLFNATFGKVMLGLVIVKKAVKVIVLLSVLLFLPQIQNVLKKLFSKVNYAKTGITSELTDGFPFYLPTNFTFDKQKQLQDLQFLLQTSIEAFANKNLVCPGNDDIHCRLSMVMDQVDIYFPYYRFHEIVQGSSTTAAYQLNLLTFTTESPTTTTTTTESTLKNSNEDPNKIQNDVEMLEEPIYLYD